MTDPWGIESGLSFAPKARRRRKRKLGGWRRLSTGQWQYRVRGVRPDGSPFELCRTCSDEQRERVELVLKGQAEDMRAGLARPIDRVTLKKWQSQCVRAGIRWRAQDKSTWKLLRSLYDYRLESLDSRVIARWVGKVLYRGQGKPPAGMASPGYVRHAFELLNRLIKRAVAERRIPGAPWGMETPPAIPRYTQAHKRRSPIPMRDVYAILRAAEKICEPQVFIRVLFLCETGVRPFELCRARRKWLLPVSEIVGAPQVQGAAVLCLPAAKKGNPHDVPISPYVYQRYREWYSSLPRDARDTGLLFPVALSCKRWGQLSKFLPTSTWRRILRSAGITEPYCAYQFRHTRLAIIANDPRLGPRVAQAVAGHKSVTTTEVYAGAARGLLPAVFSSLPYSDDSNPPDDPLPTGTDGVSSARSSATVEESAEVLLAKIESSLKEMKALKHQLVKAKPQAPPDFPPVFVSRPSVDVESN